MKMSFLLITLLVIMFMLSIVAWVLSTFAEYFADLYLKYLLTV